MADLVDLVDLVDLADLPPPPSNYSLHHQQRRATRRLPLSHPPQRSNWPPA